MSLRPRESDPELLKLLLEELRRHLLTLEGQPAGSAEAHRAVHAIKGSAGLAGEPELAATLERLHRRMSDGDETALGEAAVLVRTAIERLSAGETAVVARWPVPPDDLTAGPIDPLVRTQYTAEVSDRLARIDEALAAGHDLVEAALVIYRHVHTMKGAASAVGDEPMTWFCHGLEDRLHTASSEEAARSAIEDVARWRVVLGWLLDEPETALTNLRGVARPSKTPGARSASAASVRPTESEAPRSLEEGGPTIRVAAANVDRLLERFDSIDLVREGISSRAERTRETAAALRELRSSLIEALRLIGPARPWGAPAAALRRIERVVGLLDTLGEDFDLASSRLHSVEHALRDEIAEAKKQLSTMRQTTVGRIFARLTTAIESEARRDGRAIIVRTRGADETIDRRMAEHLVEPCLQLVRNAVAHGSEAPELRAALGKPASGTISLAARKTGNRLSITISDDGAGVDVAGVRARAVLA
ncbi:MAG: Hpt domain-containing protein, partial [Polyangiaceae bacterium]